MLFFSTVIKADVGNKPDYKVVNQNNASQVSDIPTYIEYATTDLPPLSELEKLFIQYWENPEDFGFIKVGEEKDKLGYVHYRYKQTYKNIAIEFAELIVHTKSGMIYSMNGKLIDEAINELEKSLSEEKALGFALAYIGADKYKWELPHEEAFIKESQGDEHATFFPKGKLTYVANSAQIEASSLKLAYKFKVYAHSPMSHTEIYINATNGDVLFTNNLIHTTDVEGKATTAYSGVQTINTDSVNPTRFRLRQTVSGNGINTFDMNVGFSFAAAVDFIDTDNDWNNVNAQLDEYATDAHWGAEQTYNYFEAKFNRNSIDDRGFALNSYVHNGISPNNASFDGSRMIYGDGDGSSTTPFVTLDVAGHEIAHGLTRFTADLIYASQSGALNESFSDIFGAAIEFYGRPGRANWTIGEDIGSSFRSMENPGLFGDPDTRGGSNWIDTEDCFPTRNNDQCGVHTNSGVQNFWFYLLSEGGTGTNDLGESYDVTGITIDSAAAIAFRNLTVYLTRSSNYDDARFYSIQSAIDLFGPCSQEVESVKDAWHAVGVGDAYVDGVIADFVTSDSISCSFPHTVNFEDNSNNALSYSWDFGDGNSSTNRSPSNTYQDTGKYDVTLIVDGGTCGRDTLTKTEFIDININNRCVTFLDDGTNPTQTECSGKLFDSGGGNGDYGNSENGVITIAPNGAATVTIDFINFDVEGGRFGCVTDFLEIFDGPTVNAPLLGSFCSARGTSAPGKITSTFSSITLRFTSDGSGTQDGFEMNWDCNLPSNRPTAGFLAKVDTSCTGEVAFEDNSTEVPTSWNWDFGDGNVSIEENPTHTYTLDGDYDVELIVANSFGADTILKAAVVNINRPEAPIVSEDTVCRKGDAILKVSGSGNFRWYDSEFNGNQIHTGDSIVLETLSSDTSLWVEDFVLDPIQKVGPIDSAIGTGGYFQGNQFQIFDVLETVRLVSVQVYSNSRALRVIQLRDNNGSVLQTARPLIPSGPSRVTLNFDIEPGTDYELAIGSGTPNLFRNNNGATYPYNLDNKVSITNSSAGGNFYYFFYDWEVKGTNDCLSPRKKITAYVDQSCSAAIGISENEIDASKILIYPNPAHDQFTIDYAELENVEKISLIDLTGKSVSDNLIIEGNSQVKINSSTLSSGVYFIRFQTLKTTFTKKISVRH